MLSRCLILLWSLGMTVVTGWGEEKGGAPRYGGILRIALDGPIGTVNPFKTHSRQHFGYQRLYAEGLVDLDKQANLVPGVAESWEITPDGLAYTFRIRKGVLFHNGDKLTAEDVKRSLEYTMDPKNGANYRRNLGLVEGIEVVDQFTIRVRLKKASAPFLSNLYAAFIPIMSPKSVASLNSQPVGTGPFVVEEFKQGLHLRLRRFKTYWKQGKPYVDEVLFRFVPDDSVRYTALRSADVDIADELPAQRMVELKASPPKDFRVFGLPGGNNLLFLLNTRRHPLSDVRVRQAIAFALDKQEIVNAVRWGAGEGTNQVYPKDSPWYFDVEDRKQDLAAARRLLAEAGLSQGFTLPIMVRARTMPTAQVLQAQLKMIGIQLTFEQMDTPTRLKRQRKWDFDSDLRGEGYPFDPENTFRYYYSKSGFRNYSGYNNSEYDQMYEKALVEQNFDKRKQLYLAMMRLLQRDVPEIFLMTYYRYIGVLSSVKGFEPDAVGMSTYSNGGVGSTWIHRP